jgi:hypothetical protein
MKNIKTTIMVFLCVLFISGVCSAQGTVIVPDLSKIPNGNGWSIINRHIVVSEKDSNVIVHLDGQKGDGIVWLKGFEFQNGTIEVDIKGKDVQGNSFVGIAIRGVDEATYDAIYFRPFNFMSTDSLRKGHSVQYISHPVNTWQKLREEFPGKYENSVTPIPDPNSYFHAKIVVKKPEVRVFVNNAKTPSMVVRELSNRTGGWVGLWVGNYSDGTFKNLKILKSD